MATYNSNHVLGILDDGCEDDVIPGGLEYLLYINREYTTSQVARLKIINAHFSGKSIDIQPFIHMKIGVMSHAIAWMRNDCENDEKGSWRKGFDLTYDAVSRIVVPKLFG